MKNWDTYTEACKKWEDVAFKQNFNLAQNPEISGQEVKSAEAYCQICEDAGMKVTRNVAGLPTAFVAEAVRVDNPIGKIALLCEYDALPEIGHACGHCASGSISLLTALALREMAQMNGETQGEQNKVEASPLITMDIDLVGTPDEEAAGGKVDMVKAGLFDDYDLAIMLHMEGTKTHANANFLALDDYRIQFHGKTAHAAGEPWNGVNAVNGMQLAIHALDMLRQQVRPETRIGTCIIDGGKATNIIPDFAEFACCVRHTDREYLNEVVEKVKACFEGAAIATGTTVTYQLVGNSYDSMKWNQAGVDVVEEAMRELAIPFETGMPQPAGSSDIGNVSFACPALHPELRLKGEPKVCHTVNFAAAMLEPTIKESIREGAHIIGHTLLQLMEAPEKLEKIKAEHQSK